MKWSSGRVRLVHVFQAGKLPEHLGDFFELAGFIKKEIGAELEALAPVLVGGEIGQHDDRGAGPFLPDRFENIHA